MNSFVSVEEPENVSGDIDSVVFSTCTTDAESDQNKQSDSSNNDSDFHEKAPEVILCTELKRHKVNQSEQLNFTDIPVGEVGLKKLKQGVYQAADHDSNLVPVVVNDIDTPVDLMYLPLDTVLMNCAEGDNTISLDESLDYLQNLSFDSDTDTQSFDGFSECSEYNFEGFEQLELLDNKDYFQSNFSVRKGISPEYKIADNLDCKASTPLGPSRPTKDFQNYSKSSLSPIYNTAFSQFEEKDDAYRSETTRQQVRQKGKNEGLAKSFINERKIDIPDNICSSSALEIGHENRKGLRSRNRCDSSFVNIADVNFEGFISVNNDSEDFIGELCSNVGCTISWLESRELKLLPVKITNGIVFELSEFAKKIDWEPKYVGEWLFRLKGIKSLEVDYEDLKKISNITKRRKALSVNFAGSALLKSKLLAFDREEFISASFKNLKDFLTYNNYLKNSNIRNTININKVENSSIGSNKFLKNTNGKSPIDTGNINKSTLLSEKKSESLSQYNEKSIKENAKQFVNQFSTTLSHKSEDEGKLRKNIKTISSSNSAEVIKPKLLYTKFIDDGEEIGSHCANYNIDIKKLNAFEESDHPITNGIVYELYNFFKNRKASLTSLVHTIYKLSGLSFDKSQIITTMAKIHEMVKVIWDDQLAINKNMPFEHFKLIGSENSNSLLNYNKDVDRITLNIKEENIDILDPPYKRQKKVNSPIKPSTSFSDKSFELQLTNQRPVPTPMNKAFDLNSTKGYFGKITRGDIVYLYTKWLKKKMEGINDVFVSDLSKDVEELINERKVGFIRIPVGTLMSSSVKLFEEFRKLSKIDMYEATSYLLEDWIEDMKSILNISSVKTPTSDIVEERNSESQTKENTPENGKKNNKDNTLETEISSKTHDNIFVSKPKDVTNDINSVSKPKDVTNGKPGPSTSSEEYEVQKIVGYRVVRIGEENVTEYRIRWMGFTSKDDSWINEKDLNCPEILAKFWEALNKQRALKKHNSQIAIEEKELSKEKDKFQRHNLAYFGIDKSSSQVFFNLMVQSLKPNLVDHQHEEDNEYNKRAKITKKEVLNVYDEWRRENQEHLLAGGNQKLDVSILISRLKSLMDLKKVRHFNPNCIMDVCFRMFLMKEKLKDPEKVKEYLSGDFVELMQSGQKHQEAVHAENLIKLKEMKQDKPTPLPIFSFSQKISVLDNLEKESLIIAKYMKENRVNSNIEKDLINEISYMKKFFEVEQDVTGKIENLKRANASTVKELESYGIKGAILGDLLNIASKMN